MSNHEKSQNLTIEQLNAIDLLVQGLSDREVADKVNVARETVTRWRNESAVFQAELNRKRKEIWGMERAQQTPHFLQSNCILLEISASISARSCAYSSISS